MESADNLLRELNCFNISMSCLVSMEGENGISSRPKLNPKHFNFFMVTDQPVDLAVFLEGI